MLEATPKDSQFEYLSIWQFPKIWSTIFRGPNNKDYNILGSILGSPYLGKLPFKHIENDSNLCS